MKHVFYFQVDNPLVKMCDPGFVGRHIATRSEASSKVVFKERPEEKVGVFAVVNGRCGHDRVLAICRRSWRRNASRTERLRFRAGSPAIHLFTVEFLDRVTRTGGLPYHVARKAVSALRPGNRAIVDPGQEPNALKFELFIFDALPLAERWLAVETPTRRGVRAAQERDRRRFAGNRAGRSDRAAHSLAGARRNRRHTATRSKSRRCSRSTRTS